jgi:hypothetical protein
MTKPNIHPSLHATEVLLALPQSEYRPALVVMAKQLRAWTGHPSLAQDETLAARAMLRRLEVRLA